MPRTESVEESLATLLPSDEKVFYPLEDGVELAGSVITLAEHRKLKNRKTDLLALMQVGRHRYYCIFTQGKFPVAMWKPIYKSSQLSIRPQQIISADEYINDGLVLLDRIKEQQQHFLVEDERRVLVGVFGPYDKRWLNRIKSD